MLENQLDYRPLITPFNGSNERIVLISGALKTTSSILISRSKKGMADTSKIYKQPIQTELQVLVTCHFTHNCVESVFLLDHHLNIMQ